MRRAGRYELPIVVAFLTALIALGYAVREVERLRRRDAAALEGLASLVSPGLEPVIEVFAHLADPGPYLLAVVALVAWTWSTGRGAAAVAILVVAIAAPLTTQILKYGFPFPRPPTPFNETQLPGESWPSGHSTGAMTLALCLAIGLPPRVRAVATVTGTGYALGMGYAVVVLGWHFPSDVVAAYLLAGLWALGAIAVLRRQRPLPRPGGRTPAVLGASLVVLVASGVSLLFAYRAPTTVVREAIAHPSYAAAAVAILATAMAVCAAVVLAARRLP